MKADRQTLSAALRAISHRQRAQLLKETASAAIEQLPAPDHDNIPATD